jgi:hypothetical protein
VLTEAVTVLLLLLYDSPFKIDVTMHLLDCYGWLLQLVGDVREAEGEALSAALDRLTVQLFNAEVVSEGGGGQRVGEGGGLSAALDVLTLQPVNVRVVSSKSIFCWHPVFEGG